MSMMDYVDVSRVSEIAYRGPSTGDGTKFFGVLRWPNFSNVLWDIGLLFSSEQTKAPIKISRKAQIWESPEVKEILAQPFGAPVKLTREQAIEIVKNSFGSRPDLPEGREYVRDIRLAFGESIFRKSSGESG